MRESAADIHKCVVGCNFHRCRRVAGTQLRAKLAKLAQPLQQIRTIREMGRPRGGLHGFSPWAALCPAAHGYGINQC